MSGLFLMNNFINSLSSLISNSFTQLIAIITICIAFLQYMSNKYKLRMDLYERRLKVYYITRDILHYALTTSCIEQEKYKEFDLYIAESHFLFNKTMYDYLYSLYILLKNDLVDQSPNESKTKLLSKKEEAISKEIKNLPDKFSKYLSLNKS